MRCQGRRLSVLMSLLSLTALYRAQATPLPNPPASTETAARSEPPSPPREPWKWTLDERLALRFDPNDMRRRAEEDAADLDIPPYEDGRCIVNGIRDPALLLPFELFNNLLSTGYSSETGNREVFRREILKKAKSLDFDESLWPTLRTLAHEQLQWLEESHQKAKRYSEKGEHPDPAGVEEQKARCANRAQTLQVLRAHFGAERFDRFLYEAIAPQVKVVMPYDPEWPQQLRFIEGGCK